MIRTSPDFESTTWIILSTAASSQDSRRSCVAMLLSVKRKPPDTEHHDKNCYAKLFDDNHIFMTNVDNNNSDTTYINKHKHNMREV